MDRAPRNKKCLSPVCGLIPALEAPYVGKKPPACRRVKVVPNHEQRDLVRMLYEIAAGRNLGRQAARRVELGQGL